MRSPIPFALPILLALMFGFAGVGASPRAHAEAPIANVSQESVDLAKLYDAVVETIARRFVDEDTLRRVDWRALTTSARASVIDAPSLEAAVERINALLAELKTSHTALYTPNDYQYYILLDIVGAGQNSGEFLARKFWGVGPWYPGIGAFTTKVGAAHFIDGVMEGSPAQSAGLKFGDEIVSVDGRAYSPIASFSGRVGETVALEIRRDSLAPAQIVSVPVIPIRPTAAFSASTRASARVIERNGLRIGYVHLWSINESRSFEQALAALDESQANGQRWRGPSSPDRRKLDSLIVDLRGRVGGTINAAGEILDLLDRGQKPYWGRLNIAGRADSQAAQGRRRDDGEGGSRAEPFRGRAVLLTNQYTRSAGEIVAHGFKRSGFGPIMGAPTAGAVTSGATVIMPGDLLLYVAVSTLDFDGRKLEGRGVEPDEPIDRPLPYANGADPVLDAAVDRLAGPSPFSAN